MKTQTKPTKTGNTKEIAKKEISKNGVQDKNQKEEKSSTQINEILNPTAEQRIKKIKNFNLLAKKHAFLNEKRDDLENFIVSSDGTKEKIELSNANGYKIEITNSQVVEEITEVVKTLLDKFLKSSEQEILEYTI